MLQNNTSEFFFRKTDRLLKRSEFLHVNAVGRKIHTSHFIILKAFPADSTRIGVTASRKVGNAVCRNRIRRLVREFYRLHKAAFGTAHYNIIAKKGAEQLDFQQVGRELTNALARLHS